MFLSSLAGTSGFPGLAPYCATKAGINNFVATLRLELGQYPVKTTLVAPGPVDTGMWQHLEDSSYDVDLLKRLRRLQLIAPQPQQQQFQGRQDRRDDRFDRRNDGGRPQDWRGGDRRDGNFRGNGDYRGNGNAQRGYDNRGGNWNRNWRSDSRYNWSRARNDNRDNFRLPRYYAPYGWDYGYRRFSIGFRLSSILFANNYWIDDPYYYDLPPAYGPYRWVRYYNDALLVDIYTGEVVDTVYDIFW